MSNAEAKSFSSDPAASSEAAMTPAFPCEWDYINSNRSPANGMDLRDYFAIRCLPISRSTFPGGMDGGWDALASHAYSLADAMLKARQS
jgi:hypothetical protein